MTVESLTKSLTFLTDDMPGIGGRIKTRAEDFLVEELPLYEPGGEGEHLYLFIEKRGQTTSDVVRRLAKLFKVRPRQVGYAGLKDKRAVTRQCFSIHLPDRSDIDKALHRFEFLPFTLLWHDWHKNKLRRGHLKGNRFVIFIREVDPAAVVTAKRILDRLETTGVPNYFGKQRFGYRQSNHDVGVAYLQQRWQDALDLMLGSIEGYGHHHQTHDGRLAYVEGDYEKALQLWPRHLRHERQALDALRQKKALHNAVLAMDESQREFFVSSTQSAIFNRVLDRRIREGWFDTLMDGDIALIMPRRQYFHVDAETASLENSDEGRMPTGQISPSGPMWGSRMPMPHGLPLEWELEALKQQGLDPDDFTDGRHRVCEGSRRPTRVNLEHLDVSGGADDLGPFIRVAFDLPRGSYATVALRELMKNEAEEDEQAAARGREAEQGSGDGD